MLISSMWLLEAANQSDLETGIEHNICPNPLRVNRGRKSHEKEMDASFSCSKPPMRTRRSSIPIRTTTAQHKNVKICFYITTEKEKPERGGARPADGPAGAAPAAAATFFPTAGRPRFVVSGEAPFNSMRRELPCPLLDRFRSSPGRFLFRRSSTAELHRHRRLTSSPRLLAGAPHIVLGR